MHSLLENKSLRFENQSEKAIMDEVTIKLADAQESKKKMIPKITVDKSGLLGDLKNFAKNFKMPSSGNPT